MDVMLAHAWAVLDIVRPRPVDPEHSLQLRGVLQAFAARALVAAGIPEVGVVPGGRSERLIVAFAMETPPASVATRFVEELTDRLDTYADEHDPEAAMRLTVALHWGSSDGAFAEILRLADAPVLGRVVAAAAWSPVVLAGTEDWYAEVGVGGLGHSRVRGDGGPFWIHVPGASVVPGLSPSDITTSSPPAPGRRPSWPGPAQTRAGGRTVHQEVHGSVYGDQVAGDKTVGGGVHYGPFGGDGRTS